MQKLDNRNSSWDLYSFCLIFLALTFQLLKWQLLPMFIDIYYHLSVMLGFDKAGGYVTTAFWEFAPVGRPHLYPPFLHILMLLLYKLGPSEIFIARFFSAIIYPLLIFSIWIFSRKAFDRRIAFFCTLLVSSSYYFYLESSNIIAFSFAVSLGLLSFLFLLKGKMISSVILLSLTFYTHSLTGWLFSLTILIYAVSVKLIVKYFKMVMFAILLFFPLMVHQIYNQEYFRMVNVKAMHYIDINIFIYIAASIGLVLYLRQRDPRGKLLFSFVLGFAPLFFIYPQRYLSGTGMIAIILFASCGLDYIFRTFKEKTSLLLIIFILFYLTSPTVSLSENAKLSSAALDSTFINHLPYLKFFSRANEESIYIPKFIDPIIVSIKENSGPEDIIYSNFNYAAGLFSVLSQRATSSSMLPEVGRYRDFDKISASRLIIWLKELDGTFPIALKEAINKYKLEKIQETDIAYIYKNPHNFFAIVYLFFILILNFTFYTACPKF